MLSLVLAMAALGIEAVMITARYRDGYLPELINSFLPYTFGTIFILLLVATLSAGEPVMIELVLLLSGWLLALVAGLPLLLFGYANPIRRQAKTANARVVSFNKLLTNENLEGVFYHIHHLKPDVAGILEVKTGQAKQLAQLAKHHQLHFVSRRYSMAKADLVLISKYPLHNVQHRPMDTFGVMLSAQVTINRKPLTIVLVHTASPLIPSMLAERNRGFQNLASYLNSLSTRRLIVMGDFNMTPWSKTYRAFGRQIAKHYFNLAKGRGIKFTWTFLGPIGAHIDHMFASRSIKCQDFTVDDALGSDHKLIYTDLKI